MLLWNINIQLFLNHSEVKRMKQILRRNKRKDVQKISVLSASFQKEAKRRFCGSTSCHPSRVIYIRMLFSINMSSLWDFGICLCQIFWTSSAAPQPLKGAKRRSCGSTSCHPSWAIYIYMLFSINMSSLWDFGICLCQIFWTSSATPQPLKGAKRRSLEEIRTIYLSPLTIHFSLLIFNF